MMENIRNRIVKKLLPNPLSGIRHAEYPAIGSADDDFAIREGAALVPFALEVIARGVEEEGLQVLRERAKSGRLPDWTSVWPGEHYRLLSALCRVTAPVLVVEAGTFTGASALAMNPMQPSVDA
jgi:hypothetical protein